jgi:hypothetical protein
VGPGRQWKSRQPFTIEDHAAVGFCDTSGAHERNSRRARCCAALERKCANDCGARTGKQTAPMKFGFNPHRDY